MTERLLSTNATQNNGERVVELTEAGSAKSTKGFNIAVTNEDGATKELVTANGDAGGQTISDDLSDPDELEADTTTQMATIDIDAKSFDDDDEDDNDSLPPTPADADDGVGDMRDEAMDLVDLHPVWFDEKKMNRLECICFFCFLGIFTAVAVLQAGEYSYPQTLSIRLTLTDTDEFESWNQFGSKSFVDISTIDDIYNYMETVAIPFLLDPENDFYVQSQQRLLGGIRLKQVRFKETECVADEFKNHTCYANGEWFTNTVVYGDDSGDEGGMWVVDTDEPTTMTTTVSPTTMEPTTVTENPSTAPDPSVAATGTPSMAPSMSPSAVPTQQTDDPSIAPSNAPSLAPTGAPTVPSEAPSNAPSDSPSDAPSNAPSLAPSKAPTPGPTQEPVDRRRRLQDGTTMEPTSEPTLEPTSDPTELLAFELFSTTDLEEEMNVFQTVFPYIQNHDLNDQPYGAKYGSYPGGGYVQDLPLDREEALAIIGHLRDIRWLDGATQFLTMDFNLYNPSTGLHTVARLFWEMPVGGVFPNDEIKTWKFERYNEKSGIALMVLHILFATFLLGMTLMELGNCYRLGCLGEKNLYWTGSVLSKGEHVLNLFLCYCTIGIFIYNENVRTNTINIYDQNSYVSFRRLQYGFTLESLAFAVNGILLWLRLFRFLTFSARLHFLFTMLKRSATDIFMFFIVLVIFIFAFGTAGFITFNSDVSDFRNLMYTVANMFRYVLVDMDYDALTRSSPSWGAVFYFLWSLLMLLVLANVFIAILTEAYSEVQMDLTDEGGLDEIGGKFAGKMAKWKGKFSKNTKHESMDQDGDGQIDAEEFAEQMGITVERAKEMMKKFDKDADEKINPEEFENMKKQLVEQVEAIEAGTLAPQKSLLTADEIKGGIGRRVKTMSVMPDARALSMMRSVDGMTSKEIKQMREDVDGILDLLEIVLGQTTAGRKALKDHERMKEAKRRIGHVESISQRRSSMSRQKRSDDGT